MVELSKARKSEFSQQQLQQVQHKQNLENLDVRLQKQNLGNFSERHQDV